MLLLLWPPLCPEGPRSDVRTRLEVPLVLLCFSLSDARPLWLLGCGMKELLPLAGEVDRLLLADAALFSWEPVEAPDEDAGVALLKIRPW